MTIGLRSSTRAVSPLSCIWTAQPIAQRPVLTQWTHLARRHYASEKAPTTSQQQQLQSTDTINPPETFLAPPLNLPERGDANVAVYYFRIGRAYGRFYIAGVKQIWKNHKEIRPLKERIAQGPGGRVPRRTITYSRALEDVASAEMLRGPGLTRAEFQALARDAHDWGRVPLFGLLVAVFGEWLPLLVPFIPGAVPRTCRIPKQVTGLREAQELRRRTVFRAGIEEPSETQVKEIERKMRDLLSSGMGEADAKSQSGGLEKSKSSVEDVACGEALARTVVEKLDKPQLMLVSTSLNLHRRLWDRVGMPPPTALLVPAMVRRLRYLGIDDTLLLQQSASPEQALTEEEVRIACEERGIDVLGRPVDDLRSDLSKWLAGRKKDDGTGRWLLRMLFRRPNAYNLDEAVR